MPEIHDITKYVNAKIVFRCPECREKLKPMGLMSVMFYCRNCEQPYKLALIKKNDPEIKQDIKETLNKREEI